MGKAKLAICIGDEIYQGRLARCLMNHYRDRYELHLFGEASEITEVEGASYSGYILGEEVAAEAGLAEDERTRVLLLNEENKYLEVYKLVEALELLLGDYAVDASGEMRVHPHIVGISSLTVPHLQIPFGGMLSSVYGEKEKTIFVDFQANSGFGQGLARGDDQLGMEEVMAMTMAGTYSKSQLLSAIGHYQGWDYVYPVKNSRCIQEINKDMVSNMCKLFTRELHYQRIIMNLGEGLPNQEELARLCDELYILYPKGAGGTWREKSYVQEVERRGQDDIFYRIQRVEIPSVLGADETWHNLAEQWKWNETGDAIRKIVWETNKDG